MAKTTKRAVGDPPAAVRNTVEVFEVVEIHRSELKDAPYNPRYLTASARAKLKEGVRKVGLLAPPVWNRRTGHIVGGHQRLAILDQLQGNGDYTLRVSAVDLDETREKEANLLLNNPEAQGSWDLEKLEAIIHDTPNIDLEATGFDLSDVYKLFGDKPMERQTEMDALADRLRDMSKRHEEVAASSDERGDMDYYCVVVFKDGEDREQFLTGFGLEDNRYQSGKVLRRILEEFRDENARLKAVTAGPTEPALAAMSAPGAPRGHGRT